MARTVDLYSQVVSNPVTFQFTPIPIDMRSKADEAIENSKKSKKPTLYSKYSFQDDFSTSNFATGDKYIKTQDRCFLRFINYLFLKNDQDPIEDLIDLSSGPRLTKLCKLLAPKVRFPKSTKPKQRIHKLQNIRTLIKFLDSDQKIPLPGIKPTNIVDGDKKYIVSLVWSLIKVYVFKDPNWAEKTLLHWLKETLKDYDSVVMKNLATSFIPGLPFVALVHRFSPLFHFPSISKDDSNFTPSRLCEYAFSNAERFLNIPRLLEPSDFQGVKKADTNSVSLYLWFFYNFQEPSYEPATRKTLSNETSFVVPARTEQVQLQIDTLFEQQNALDTMENQNRELNDRIALLHDQNLKLTRRIDTLESENKKLRELISPDVLISHKLSSPKVPFQHEKTGSILSFGSTYENTTAPIHSENTSSSTTSSRTASPTKTTVPDTPTTEPEPETTNQPLGPSALPCDTLSSDPTTTLPEVDRSITDNPNLAKLRSPPQGYTWIWIPEIKGAFMCPSTWEFRKKIHSENHIDCLVSAEHSSSQEKNPRDSTLVLINILKNHHLTSGISGKEYASNWISELSDIVKTDPSMVLTNVNDAGVLNPAPFRNYSTLHIDKSNAPHIRVVNMLLVNDVTNTVYVFAFRTPIPKWNKTWALAQPILKQVAINKKI